MFLEVKSVSQAFEDLLRLFSWASENYYFCDVLKPT